MNIRACWSGCLILAVEILSLSTREEALGVGGLGASNFVLVPTGTRGLGTDRFPSTRTASRQRCCGGQFVSSSVSPRRRHRVVTEVRKMPNLARRGSNYKQVQM